MKLKIILAGAIFCAMVAAPAHAVTKCVALSSSGTQCSYTNPGDNVVDWTATCKKNGVSTPIKGIGICSANKGSTSGATAAVLEISSTATENLNCWCRMISPAVSRWVFNRSYSSTGDCAQDCAHHCANKTQLPSTFSSAMFGSLSD